MCDFLSSDQTFVFADEIVVYQGGKVADCLLAIVDEQVYIIYMESKGSIASPFDIHEVSHFVMSPSCA